MAIRVRVQSLKNTITVFYEHQHGVTNGTYEGHGTTKISQTEKSWVEVRKQLEGEVLNLTPNFSMDPSNLLD